MSMVSTSAIQTQLDGKYATSGGELTGSVTITTGFPDLALKSNGERRLDVPGCRWCC